MRVAEGRVTPDGYNVLAMRMGSAVTPEEARRFYEVLFVLFIRRTIRIAAIMLVGSFAWGALYPTQQLILILFWQQ